MKRMLASALALAVTVLGTFTLIPAAYAPAAHAAARAPAPAAVTPGFRLTLRTLPVRTVLPVIYTVASGDTLSGLAIRYCGGNDKDWTGFYEDNRARIGPNPNRIYPGQQLGLLRCTDPPSLLHLGSTYRAPVRHAIRYASGGKIWKVTYGYPYFCGDGDGDGWDMPCTTAGRGPAPAPRAHAVRRAVTAAVTGSSHYSYAGLEALWVSAGGPGWAAPRAAEIAECESGGNVYAHNASGATGLFQILGQVVGGNLYNPYVNALNAVAKFRASGDTFAAWVCR